MDVFTAVLWPVVLDCSLIALIDIKAAENILITECTE